MKKEQFYILICTILYYIGLGFGLAWQDGVKIKSHLNRDELQILGSFEGHTQDHLTLLRWTENNIFVGARDALFNLSTRDLKLNSKINWTTTDSHREQCIIKGQKDQDCHNYVRVFHGPLRHHNHNHNHHKSSKEDTNKESDEDSTFILCGTNAFKPKCRYYDSKLANVTHEFSGQAISPFDPNHKSTSVLHHGSVYSGTVADFSGNDALIYKDPLRTEQYDLKHLNNPSFVSSMSFGDFSLFFFREVAIEHANCGKTVFSRVARICRHDSGSRKHKDRFTTFLKARLNCSIPGEFPFYFDHIQGTTDIITNTQNSQEMIYAVFTTPPNSIQASAVCAFTTQSILKVFEGHFKGQTTFDSNWLPIPDEEVPKPRPGQCLNDPTYQPNSNAVAFLKANPLMDETVQGKVVLTSTSNKNMYTSIAVDSSAEIRPYHIIYIGTESGLVHKAIVNMSASINVDRPYLPEESVISQSWNLFPVNEPIKSLRLVSPKRLMVSTETQMIIIRVDNCGQFYECTKCLEIRDPHCGWDTDRNQCVSKDPEIDGDDREKSKSSSSDINLIQDVDAGALHLCPIDEKSNDVILEANHLKSSIVEEESRSGLGDELCPCTTPQIVVNDLGPVQTQDRDKEQQNAGSQYFGHNREQIIIAAANESYLENEIPRFNHNKDSSRPDFESSYVRSSEALDGSVSSKSVILATMSSAIISLLIGFALGFISSRWISLKKGKKSSENTNAQIANMNEQQRLTKPIDFVVNLPPTLNKNPLKNNLNMDTLEKTVKKIYL